MAKRTVAVASIHGLHARPAALFTQAAKDSGVPVTVSYGDKSADASSILGVLLLGVESGQEVSLEADGETADEVLDRLVELLMTPDGETST